jgi:putative endonuclease
VSCEALAKRDKAFIRKIMFYVYLIASKSAPEERYIGSTDDLKKRLADHNAGKSIHTNKFKPWKLVTYLGFETRSKAEKFERYLKHGSGHAFAKRHLW